MGNITNSFNYHLNACLGDRGKSKFVKRFEISDVIPLKGLTRVEDPLEFCNNVDDVKEDEENVDIVHQLYLN